jgi:hypothetical protein
MLEVDHEADPNGSQNPYVPSPEGYDKGRDLFYKSVLNDGVLFLAPIPGTSQERIAVISKAAAFADRQNGRTHMVMKPSITNPKVHLGNDLSSGSGTSKSNSESNNTIVLSSDEELHLKMGRMVHPIVLLSSDDELSLEGCKSSPPLKASGKKKVQSAKPSKEGKTTPPSKGSRQEMRRHPRGSEKKGDASNQIRKDSPSSNIRSRKSLTDKTISEICQAADEVGQNHKERTNQVGPALPQPTSAASWVEAHAAAASPPQPSAAAKKAKEAQAPSNRRGESQKLPQPSSRQQPEKAKKAPSNKRRAQKPPPPRPRSYLGEKEKPPARPAFEKAVRPSTSHTARSALPQPESNKHGRARERPRIKHTAKLGPATTAQLASKEKDTPKSGHTATENTDQLARIKAKKDAFKAERRKNEGTSSEGGITGKGGSSEGTSIEGSSYTNIAQV